MRPPSLLCGLRRNRILLDLGNTFATAERHRFLSLAEEVISSTVLASTSRIANINSRGVNLKSSVASCNSTTGDEGFSLLKTVLCALGFSI